MILNSLLKNTRLMCLAGSLAATLPQMNAAPIEHIGDRYIMHVSEMELTGEESLLDVLMMCPEVTSASMATTSSAVIPSPINTASSSSVSTIRNTDSTMPPSSTISRLVRLESIKVCQNAEVMKGCSSLKKVIDITLRKRENGVTGRWGLFGDTYGGAKGIVSVLSQQDNLRILSHVEGNFQRTSNSDKDAYQGISGSNTVNHYSHEGAKLNVLWTPTSEGHTRNGCDADLYPQSFHPFTSRLCTCLSSAGRLYPDARRAMAPASSSPWVPSISATMAAHRKKARPSPYQNHSTYPFGGRIRHSSPYHQTFGLQQVLRAVSPSRRIALPITSTIPTTRISMSSWITISASGDSWLVTDSASSTSALSRLRLMSTGSIPPTTISTR